MQWLLTVSDSFSLTHLLSRSYWLLYPPFSVNTNAGKLYRIEQLQSGQSVAFTVAHLPAGLSVECESQLSGYETEEVSQKVWRMLRLGENLQPFLNKAKQTPALASVEQYGARLLRGATFFEDVVKAAVIAYLPVSARDRCLAWLVDSFGEPLLGNPTLHAFPGPRNLLADPAWLRRELGAELSEQLVRIAEAFQTQHHHVRFLSVRYAYQSLKDLRMQLQYLFALDDVALSLIMLNLGRYDYIPADLQARRWVGASWPYGDIEFVSAPREVFARWQPWGGLAYWLWDWEVDSRPGEVWKGESTYGKLEDRVRAY